MMRIKRLLTALMMGIVISGCGSTPSVNEAPASLDQLPPELRQVAIISSFNPSKAIPISGSFGWMPQSLQNFESPQLERSKLNDLLQGEIRKVLESKGYTYAATDGGGDLLVGYYIALETARDDVSINELYGLKYETSWGEASAKEYPKGALILDIVDAGTREPLWRGALNAYVDYELDDDIRKQRIQRAVHQLLSDFPR